MTHVLDAPVDEGGLATLSSVAIARLTRTEATVIFILELAAE